MACRASRRSTPALPPHPPSQHHSFSHAPAPRLGPRPLPNPSPRPLPPRLPGWVPILLLQCLPHLAPLHPIFRFHVARCCRPSDAIRRSPQPTCWQPAPHRHLPNRRQPPACCLRPSGSSPLSWRRLVSFGNANTPQDQQPPPSFPSSPATLSMRAHRAVLPNVLSLFRPGGLALKL